MPEDERHPASALPRSDADRNRLVARTEALAAAPDRVLLELTLFRGHLVTAVTSTRDAGVRPAQLPCAGAPPAAPAAATAAGVRGHRRPRPNPQVQARVEAFMVEQYAAGRSLRQLAELTDRSFSAVRNILNRRGVHRRGAGAEALREPRSER